MLARSWFLLIVLLLCPALVRAGDPLLFEDTETWMSPAHRRVQPSSRIQLHPEPMHSEGHQEHKEEPSDLTIRNFFAGWDEEFQSRSRRGRAPRFHLFTTKQPFLDREVRVNYFFQKESDEESADLHDLGLELNIPFNRRLMLFAEPTYTWINGKEGTSDKNGPGLLLSAFYQLVDTYDSALNFQFGVIVPSVSLGVELSELGLASFENRQTQLSFVLAGFEDLTRRLGLYRTGFSYHLEYITRVGPEDPDEPSNLTTYALSLANTITEPDTRYLRDFTLFVEAFGVTELDSTHAGRTAVTLTPGFRFNAGSEESTWWVMIGVQYPLTGPKPFDYTARISIIHWFD